MSRRNDMDAFTDSEEDSETTVTTTSYLTEPDIIIHKPSQNDIRLANSMSFSSDSDSDFEDTQNKSRHKVKVKILTPQKRSAIKKSTVRSSKINKIKNLGNKELETSSTTKNVSVSKSSKKSPQINVISVERVNIPIKQNKNNAAKRPNVARNIFESKKDNCTQTSTDECSNCAESVTSTQNNDPQSKNDVEVQTDNAKSITEAKIKRSHSTATQTKDCSNNSERSTVVQIEVSPPKRFRTIHDDCPVLRIIDEHACKLEEAKMNLMQLFNRVDPVNQKSENYKNTPNSVKKTPMRQLKMDQLYFCKSSPKSTPNTTPLKSTSTLFLKSPKTSPKKKQQTPEKKETTRYSQENHNRVYENVSNILNWVFEKENFSILFTKSETDLLKELFELSDRRLTVLCIRLFTRQHKWYNLLNFCEELNLTDDNFNLREFYKILTKKFVSGDYSGERTEILLNYLTAPDIKDICKFLRIRPSNKQFMINKLLEYSTKQCTLTSLKRAEEVLREKVKQKLGICVKLETNVKNMLFRIHLLYSLTNPGLEGPNDIYNEMYKIRNELINLPKVQIDSPLIFSGRQEFLKFADARLLSTEFDEQIEKKDVANEYLFCVEAFNRLKDLLSDKAQIQIDQKKPLFLRRFTAAWIYCRVLGSGSQNLGKQYPDDVCKWLREMLKQEVYCPRSRGRWHLQLAVVTRAHKKDIIGEAQILIDALSDKFINEVQKHELSIRASKIQRKKLSQMLYDELHLLLLPEIEIPVSRTIQANAVHNNEPGKKLRFVRTTNEGKEYSSVEQTAINYYTTNDNYEHGIHCEGQLLSALFYIMFYDILYNIHVKNTFITEIQDKPLDLFSGEFYSNRSSKIATRLKNIRETWTVEEVCTFASNISSDYNSELKSLTNFDLIQEDTFHTIIKCIGQKLLAAILERFAKDYKQFHSGLPDLFLWNPDALTCCFVEVKSEKDKLSTKQILWINYLHQFDAKVEVCYVEHIGSTSTKKTKKYKGDMD